MERGGGFQGYQKTPNTSSGLMNQYSNNSTMGNRTTSSNNMNNDGNIINGHMNNNNSNNNGNGTTSGDDNECTVREQDRFMPIANVIRIMRKILPPHAKISDDAKETIQECVSEYISFVTGEANERCQREQRKTITAEDVLWAMSKLGFDDHIEPLTLYLHRYRDLEGDHRGGLNLMMKPPATTNTSTSVVGAVDHHHQYYNGAPPPPSLVAAFHHGAFFGYQQLRPPSDGSTATTTSSSPSASMNNSSTQLQQPNGDRHQQYP